MNIEKKNCIGKWLLKLYALQKQLSWSSYAVDCNCVQMNWTEFEKSSLQTFLKINHTWIYWVSMQFLKLNRYAYCPQKKVGSLSPTDPWEIWVTDTCGMVKLSTSSMSTLFNQMWIICLAGIMCSFKKLT